MQQPKSCLLLLQKLGKGSFLRGLYTPDTSITNPFEKRKLNHQLGLFDDYAELGSAGRFAKLGLDPNFMGNPILKHAKLSKESATFLHDLIYAVS